LSITSFPPTLAVLAAVDDELEELDELLELPPQAATTTDTMASDVSHAKRFIDTLHPQVFGKCLNKTDYIVVPVGVQLSN
jgi:hypothetical protein